MKLKKILINLIITILSSVSINTSIKDQAFKIHLNKSYSKSYMENRNGFCVFA